MTIITKVVDGKLQVQAQAFTYPAGIPDTSADPLRNPDAIPGGPNPVGIPFWTTGGDGIFQADPLVPAAPFVEPDEGFPAKPEDVVRFIPVIATVETPDIADAFTAVKAVGKGDTVELILNTPGGDVDLGMKLIAQIEALRKGGSAVITDIVDYAASMGAMLFIAGDTRIMGKNDIILFHEPNTMFGTVQLSYSEIQEIADTGTLTKCTYPDTLAFIQSAEGQKQVAEIRDLLKQIAPGFRECREQMVAMCMERLKKSDSWVREYLIVPFKNSQYTGTQALEMGIATELDPS